MASACQSMERSTSREANVAKTMAEEIRIHSQIGRDEKGQYCKGCQHRYGYAAERKLHWDASEHVAAALSAAGYGLVTDFREANLKAVTEEIANPLRQRDAES